MGMEAIKGAGMNFQAGASAPEVRAEVAHKVEHVGVVGGILRQAW